jgi:hypothetical protein
VSATVEAISLTSTWILSCAPQRETFCACTACRRLTASGRGERADLIDVERARIGELEAPGTAPAPWDGQGFLATEQIARETLWYPGCAAALMNAWRRRAEPS